MLSHSPRLHLEQTQFEVIPNFSPVLFLHSPLFDSASEFLALLCLLTSFMFIFAPPPLPPTHTHNFSAAFFFFELPSAYSRAYNLTPPSSLTLSLHPLAKLPFRSRGNPLISRTHTAAAAFGGVVRGDRGGERCGLDRGAGGREGSWGTKPLK